MARKQGKDKHRNQIPEFTCIAKEGFGDPLNEIAHSLAWFRDRLYCGVSRLRVKGRHVRPGVALNETPTSDERAQIWSYHPGNQKWDQAFVSPLLKPADGVEAPRDVGYRKMAIFAAKGETEPALYVSTISPFGGRLLCSKDGKAFAPVRNTGLQSLNAWSFRVLVPFDGKLYLSPTGKIGKKLIDRNLSETPVIFESANPAKAWQPISEPGFTEPSNSSIFALLPLNGHLYAGTTNPDMGFQIWKTPTAAGQYHWEKILTAGAFRGNSNQSAVSMCAFGGDLYIGTGIQGPGRDKTYNTGPAAAELIRIHPDDTWDLIVGEDRRTFDGLKEPLSGLGPGFDNESNSVIWQLAVHDGWLYAGTHDWRSFLSFRNSPARGRRPGFFERFSEENFDEQGGFELWRSKTGTDWEPVTRDGFGNPRNYGLRTMVSTPTGLFLGTVTIPPIGAGDWAGKNDHGKGGCEIWWTK
ncbi:MAG: hypothetical protein ACE5G1_01300 [bacterium]